MQLYGEDELRGHIRAKLGKESQVATDLLKIGTDIFRSGVRIKPEATIDDFEVWICFGTIAKACRQYRAIGALAEIGLGDVAESIGRMLSETMLASLFLMRPTVVLKQKGIPLPEVPGFPLTTAFRTKLYLANDAVSGLKAIRSMVESGDITNEDAPRVMALAESHVNDSGLEIGDEWMRRIKKSRTYSGIEIAELAASLDHSYLYNVFYRPSCSGVHGADARKYITPTQRPDGGLTFSTCSSGKGIADALVFSSLLMFEILRVATLRFGLGLDESLSNIGPRIRQMSHRLPEE